LYQQNELYLALLTKNEFDSLAAIIVEIAITI